MSAPDLQDVMARLAQGDWDAMSEIEARFGARPEAREARALAKEQEAELIAACASLPDAFLEWLHAATWGRMTFSVMLHPDPMQAVLYGAFREGQNALAMTILKLAAQGRGKDQPPLKGESDVPTAAPQKRGRIRAARR